MTDKLKIKFAKAIFENCIQISTYGFCVFCLSGTHSKEGIVHRKSCIVLDAKKFLIKGD